MSPLALASHVAEQAKSRGVSGDRAVRIFVVVACTIAALVPAVRVIWQTNGLPWSIIAYVALVLIVALVLLDKKGAKDLMGAAVDGIAAWRGGGGPPAGGTA